MIVYVLTWGSTRFAFAFATLFHLGVMLTMSITFSFNVLAYGFVVPWDRVRLAPWLFEFITQGELDVRTPTILAFGTMIMLTAAVYPLGM